MWELKINEVFDKYDCAIAIEGKEEIKGYDHASFKQKTSKSSEKKKIDVPLCYIPNPWDEFIKNLINTIISVSISFELLIKESHKKSNEW